MSKRLVKAEYSASWSVVVVVWWGGVVVGGVVVGGKGGAASCRLCGHLQYRWLSLIVEWLCCCVVMLIRRANCNSRVNMIWSMTALGIEPTSFMSWHLKPAP